MRFVNYIRLYKTPLDSNYSNVYDDYSTQQEYITFLSNFPNIYIPIEDDISTPIIKSRRDNNGTFSLVIAGFDSMELHDYNYLLVWIKSQSVGDAQTIPKFAFITGVDSVNDGDTSKSCFITCKLDAWSNHYLELKASKIISSVDRMIIKDYYGQNYIGDNKTITLPAKITNVESALCQTFYVSGKLCTIIWERFQLSEKTRTSYNTKIISACYRGNGIYVYRIAGVLDLESRELVPVTFTHGSDTYVTNAKELNLYSNVSTSDYVLSVDLTVWVPFPYVVSDSFNLVLPSNLTYDQYGYFDNNVFYPDCSGFSRSNINTYINGYKECILRSPTIPTVSEIQDLLDDNTFLYRYPFVYYSLFGNGLNLPILFPDYDTRYYINVEYEGRLYPEIFLYKNFNNVTDKIIIQRLPSMYLEYDENANYLRNNQNKLLLTEHYLNVSNIISQTKSAGDLATSYLGIGVKGAYNRMFGAMDSSLDSLYKLQNFYASREDVKWQRGAVINGETASHFLTLDEVVIYENNAYEFNKYETIEIAKDLAYNGISISGVFNVLENNRSRYDYCVCKNPIIPISLNDSDKNEIVRALRNGMRRWHISVPSYTFDISQRNSV